MSGLAPAPGFGQADLTNCDREPIHIPGSIQPHGLLLVLDPDTLAILQAAGDAGRLLGWPDGPLLGAQLGQLLPPETLAAIIAAREDDEPPSRIHMALEATLPDGRVIDLILHRGAAGLMLEIEPLAAAPVPETQFATNGLVELLALDNRGTLLALERSFSTGVGNAIKLFLVDTRHATDVAGVEALAGAHYRPVEKTLLLDFDDLGLTLDNLEGMTLGPDLPDGRRSLVLVADDNFSATQVTQILAFGLDLDRQGHAAQHGGHDIW